MWIGRKRDGSHFKLGGDVEVNKIGRTVYFSRPIVEI